MTTTLSRVIADLLAFQLKQAARHDLDEIRITVPRAREILRELRANKEQSGRMEGKQ